MIDLEKACRIVFANSSAHPVDKRTGRYRKQQRLEKKLQLMLHRSGKIVAEFSGSREAKRPELKWFLYG